MIVGDPRRTDTFVKADLDPSTCVIIEDNGRRSLRKILEAVRDAGRHAGLRARHRHRRRRRKRAEEFHAEFPDVAYLVDVGAVRRPAADRVQPIADARAACSSTSATSATPTAC